jgi:dTDP-4-dehydrorhamnose 3,5-epimerase-like enzyme
MHDEIYDMTSDSVRMVDVPCIVDERGALCFVEGASFVFEVKRIFWIYGVKEGQTRGNHAHESCAEVVFPVNGSFDIEVDDGVNCSTYHMDCPNRGILIPAKVWCCLKNFSTDAVCVVLASHEYDSDGYIHNYETFKQVYG